MFYILTGVIAFLSLLLFDFVVLRNYKIIKPLIWIVGTMLFLFSLLKISFYPQAIDLPFWIVCIGWTLLIVSSVLLIVTLFINIPTGRTYVVSNNTNKLVTSGFYSLTRHPGVLWFLFLMISMVLVTRSLISVIAAPIFVVCDVAVAYVEDRYIFPRLFKNYGNYKSKTPFLMPNSKSFRDFVRYLKPMFAHDHKEGI